MFGSRALRDVFGSKNEDVRGYWREVCNEELDDLYCSNFVWIAKSVVR
jgi:hypothetical protein